MRNLFNFIIRNFHWLLAALLVAFSFFLVFSYNPYQRDVYLSSANSVTGWCFSLSKDVSSFFHLRKNNRLLLERSAELEMEIHNLKNRIDFLTATDTAQVNAFVADSVVVPQFHFIPAEVVNMSLLGVNNFITIDKGSQHGIKPDMGVISTEGVVGIVSAVKSRFSVIIPVINPKFRLSARLKNSDNYGSVYWNGDNVREAQLQELPKHEAFHEGDTVLTSFSRIFPKNTIIGFVSSKGNSKDDNFNMFNIQIATNFYTLQDVLVINDSFHEEQDEVEEMF